MQLVVVDVDLLGRPEDPSDSSRYPELGTVDQAELEDSPGLRSTDSDLDSEARMLDFDMVVEAEPVGSLLRILLEGGLAGSLLVVVHPGLDF